MRDRQNTFDTEIYPAGDGTVLVAVRRESPRRTAIFAGSEEGGEWHSVGAMDPVHDLMAAGERWWLRTDEAVHESRDGGRTFTALPLPNWGPYHAMALGGDGPWVASGELVLAHESGAWEVRWALPADAAYEQISQLRSLGDNVLALTNRGRIYRGYVGARNLANYSEGLPPPLTGHAYQTPTLSVVDEWLFTFIGGLYLRRVGEDTWKPVGDEAPPELAGIAVSHSAEWVQAPWSGDVWIGTDGMAVLECGPGRPLRRAWWPPEPGFHEPKGVAPGASAVFVSLRRATSGLCGLAVRDGNRVDPIALPVD